MSYNRIDLSRYIVISIWFGCNNDCSICMLSGLKEKMSPIGFDGFKRVLGDIVKDGKLENLILSGAEVTTCEHLDRYVRYAASLRWFKKIQIQTNGRRLADRSYVKHLVDCGVNEFFISVHGLGDIHDAITRVPGSFRETMKGLENLADLDVNIITNTVLSNGNFNDIINLMGYISRQRVSEIHLWNFYPMERSDSRDMLVRMSDFLGLLPRILSIVERAGGVVVFKSFPECLSMGGCGFFDDGYPVTLLPDMFWEKFGENGFGSCIYRDQCSARECWGLSSAYIERYGNERELLTPIA